LRSSFLETIIVEQGVVDVEEKDDIGCQRRLVSLWPRIDGGGGGDGERFNIVSDSAVTPNLGKLQNLLRSALMAQTAYRHVSASGSRRKFAKKAHNRGAPGKEENADISRLANVIRRGGPIDDGSRHPAKVLLRWGWRHKPHRLVQRYPH
jgi:hypothetical protein